MISRKIELTSRYGMRTEEFSKLMEHRVREILLVASHYDAFVLEEDGQLTELVFEEYRNLDLNLRYAPRFARAASAAEALDLVKERLFDMVIATPRLPDMRIADFASELRSALHARIPIGLLAAHAWELPQLQDLRASGDVDWLFLWQGNVKSMLAIIKQVEDRLNADHDVLEGGVQAIILVEDGVRFYSAYLPNIYTEVTTQTSRLMAEGLNLSHRLLRIRARPKILLAQTYEEAWELYERYQKNLLGIISDISYPRQGRLDREAGLRLIRKVRAVDPDIPLLLQSMDAEQVDQATQASATFLHKASPNLLEEIRHYIQDHFGFGDFVFKRPDGTEVARARDMRELAQTLAAVPEETILFHASRNHFSAWLKARTEFELAALLKPRKVSDFPTVSELRDYLITTITTYWRQIQSHVITDFDGNRFDEFVAFAKIGSGSLGGKGRGLAFMHKLLARLSWDVPGVEVAIPQTVAVASDVFQDFLEENGLRGIVNNAKNLSDVEILDQFRCGRFPTEIRGQLAAFLGTVTEPLAVRSSSILEDSMFQPFAGVYATVMLPNSHHSLDVRLAQLLEAIKVVYSSTYFYQARAYLETTPYRIEEEQMAVLLQRLVGTRRGDLFYPTVSGVASSYNFYPFHGLSAEEGVAQLAVGLGKSVVEGFEALRFSPSHPQILPQFSSVKDILRNAQRRFYALDMTRRDVIPGLRFDESLVRRETAEAISDSAANAVISTYDHANNRINSGSSPEGAPLITFSSLLKGRPFDLPRVISLLLDSCQKGIGSPVEMELALDLHSAFDRPEVLNVLQVRPMVVEEVFEEVDLGEDALEHALVYSESALGHGRSEAIADVVVIDPDTFQRSDTAQAAMVIEKINRRLRAEDRHCILLGPGRWGSQDPWLGIPVAWSQISCTRAIVETDFLDLQVEPSLGSHFFHNLTCFGVAFFAAHDRAGLSFINWEWFRSQPAETEELDGSLRHIRLASAIKVLVDGSSGRGVIMPGGE